MSDRDNITLPREVVKLALEAFEAVMPFSTTQRELKIRAVEALRAHLAAEQPKQKPVAWMFVNLDGECEQIVYGTPPTDDDSITFLYTAPPEDESLRRDAERYNWVLKWLMKNGLLSRERCRIDSPESFGDWWVFRKPHGVGVLVLGYGEIQDAAIDAAMGDKT